MKNVKVDFTDAQKADVWGSNLWMTDSNVEIYNDPRLEIMLGQLLGALHFVATHPSESISGPLTKHMEHIQGIYLNGGTVFTAHSISDQMRVRQGIIRETNRIKPLSLAPFNEKTTPIANQHVLEAISRRLPQFVPADLFAPLTA